MTAAPNDLEWSDPQSYYLASAQALAAQPALSQDLASDYLVIGGGMTGASAALRLAEAGQQVTLIEAKNLGWGASGRSGGQMIIGFCKSFSWLRKHYGAATARTLFDASVQGIAQIDTLIKRHGIEADFRCGHYHVATKKRQHAELRAMLTDYRAAGFPHARLLDTEAAQAAVCSPRVTQALYDPISGHLHPLNYTLGLHRASLKAGAQLYEHTAANKIIERADGSYSVSTSTGYHIHARKVLLAGNAYLGDLYQPISSRIMPVGTYMIATEPLGDNMSGLIPDRAAVADMDFVLNYFRPSREDRLLFGGRVAYSARTPSAITQRMHNIMQGYFPQIAEAKIDFIWGGNVAITQNRMPDTGYAGRHQHLLYAQGFSGHGVILTTVYGQLCAEVMMGDADATRAWQHFSAIRHRRFPGGKYGRTLLLMLAMSYYRLLDRL